MYLSLEEAREYLAGEQISDDDLEKLLLQLEVIIKHIYQSEIERGSNGAT